ncbi:S1C family serine protease [Aristophania vespae]|uniref:S1C family serine protease n=1 Tax=Aristophania vespae TaxID=2697033 RepID=UPI001F36070E|nr:trypsin-like peptidase domain-containing protein [Aristophania vespae]
MKRLVHAVLIPALAGGLTAGAVCAVFVAYESNMAPKSQEAAGHSFLRKRFFHNHPPSVPISAPLVRPNSLTEVPKKKETSAEKVKTPSLNSALSSDLPSFAPLVRRVIPAVVNISISRDPADREVKPKAKAPIHKKVPSHTKRRLQKVHPRPHKKILKRAKKHVSSKVKHRHINRKIIHPADDDMTGAGSGFIVDPSGLIVTNRHVIGGATKVTVSLSDGRSLSAHLLGDDPMTDIAVIKVDTPTPLPCVTWGDSRQVEIGDWILVAGNPFGFGSSVTAGIISAVGRDLGIGALDDFMQLDAPINPGNSGGLLLTFMVRLLL